MDRRVYISIYHNVGAIKSPFFGKSAASISSIDFLLWIPASKLSLSTKSLGGDVLVRKLTALSTFLKEPPYILFFFCFFGGDRDTFDQEPPGPVWKMLSKSIGSVEPLRPMLPSCSITQCFVSHITQQIPLIPYDWTPGLTTGPEARPLWPHWLGKNPSAAVACFQDGPLGMFFHTIRPSQVSNF